METQQDDNMIPLFREHFKRGQCHVIEVLARTLEQIVTEYLRGSEISKRVMPFGDMIPDVLETELELKEELDNRRAEITSDDHYPLNI
jgi:hypothetical protein